MSIPKRLAAVLLVLVGLGERTPAVEVSPYLPNGTVGGAYAASIVTSGGTAPYTWVLGAGSLPPGITIDKAKGILRGSPTLAGTYNFFVLTTDAGGDSTSSEINAGVLAAQFTLTVN